MVTRVEVSFSRRKIGLQIFFASVLLALLFVCDVGIWFSDKDYFVIVLDSPILLFLAAFLRSRVPMYYDKRPALIIDQLGITNRTTTFTMPIIEWGDVKNVTWFLPYRGPYLVLVKVKSRTKYLNQSHGWGFIMAMLLSSFKRDLPIFPGVLETRVFETHGLLQTALAEFKNDRHSKLPID